MINFIAFASAYLLGLCATVYYLGMPLKEPRVGRVIRWAVAVSVWPLTTLSILALYINKRIRK